MINQNKRVTGGPTEIEHLILTGFKWTALALTVIFALAFLVSTIRVVVSAVTPSQTLEEEVVEEKPPARTLERYIALPPDPNGATGTSDLPAAVFTSMPEAQRKEVYQALYDRIRQLGGEFDLIGDENTLVTVVNGAIATLDGTNYEDRGTHAYVYLVELIELAEALGARRAADDPTVPATLSLEVLAKGLATDLRAAKDRRAERAVPPRPAPQAATPAAPVTTLADRLFLTLAFAVAALLSGTVWALLSFIAQGKTYWIVQQGGKG